MQIQTIVIGLMAVIFGGSAATGVYLFSSSSSNTPEVSMTSIVTAKSDVARGVSLTAEMIELRPWPSDFLPEGAILSLEEALDRSVSIPLVKDEPLLGAKLAAKGSGRGMAALIPRGKRAVTIQTPNVSTGVAGFILPGNKVDVLLTLSNPGKDDATGGGGTTTLLQNVEILAVDQRIEAPSENVVDPKELRSVTLLVTPAEAARLDLGQNKGVLSLALRNPEDTITTEIESATLNGLRLNRVGPLAAAELPSVPVESSEQVSQKETPKISWNPPIRTLRGSSSGFVYVQPVQ